jgi:transglutaminase-like putative cysteine protease
MVTISSLSWWFTHAIVLCGMLPLFPWLTTAPRLAIAAGFLASFWQLRRGAWNLSGWLLNSAIVPVFLVYLFQYRSSNAVQPVVSVLTFMLALRLVSEKSVRHHLQIHALALFCLASSSLFDLSPTFLFFLTILLFLEASALVLLTYYAADSRISLTRRELRTVLTVGGMLPLLSLPLLLLFFPILPRTQMPLWHFMAGSATSSTGFSEKVEPGVAAQQLTVRERVFRAETGPLAAHQRYWRVTVLNSFDGTRWQRTPPKAAERSPDRQGSVALTIYLEPGGIRFLPLLDAPVTVSGTQFQRSADQVYERIRRSANRLVYHATSDTAGVIPMVNRIDIKPYLELPANIAPRINQLARQIRQQGVDASQRIALLNTLFRNGGYRYSQQGMPTGAHALEQFLFEGKQGNCEFFASAYALLLRGAGVPARLVGGYLGGEYNQLGSYYLVSEDMAHVWVEAWLDGRGWCRIDPSSFASNADQLWGVQHQTTLLQRLRLLADASDYYWNRTVVSYDLDRQVQAVHSIGKQLQRFEFGGNLQRTVPYLLLSLSVLVGWYLWKQRSIWFAAREARILQRYYRRLEVDCGIRVEPGKAGIFELAQLSGSSQAEEFAAIYGSAIYHGRRLTNAEYQRLREICRSTFRSLPE